MNIESKRQIALFLGGASFAFYLLGAAWSAIFIIPLPQDPDWCQEWLEMQTGENSYEERCVAFKDDDAEIKHYHNQEMVRRYKYRFYGSLVMGGLLGTLAFHNIPKWRGERTSSDTLFVGFALGALAAFLGPLVFSWILPAPIHWFPREFAEIRQGRVNAALRELGVLP